MPKDRWASSSGSKPKWQALEVGRDDVSKKSSGSGKFSHVPKTYWGNHPMTRTQLRRFQRKKKAALEKSIGDRKQAVGKGLESKVSRQQFDKTSSVSILNRNAESYRPKQLRLKDKVRADDDMSTDDFDSDSAEELNIICVVSILPSEFDRVSRVTDEEDDYFVEEEDDNPKCYYLMNKGGVIEDNAVFEKPTPEMQTHLKPLFVWARVNGIGVGKVLVDGGAAINLMPRFLLKKLGKSEADLQPNSMVLSDYEGKTGKSLGVIVIDISVGTVTRSTLFVVIPAKANYNLLLGREWIHGVGAVPSTLHQRLSIWRPDGVLENVEADQSYFIADCNVLDHKTFEKRLATIAPYDAVGRDDLEGPSIYSLRLDPNYGFQFDRIYHADERMGGPVGGWIEEDEDESADVYWRKDEATLGWPQNSDDV